ncbi:MAG TPA: ROK family protein [Tepidisphaeraceae bacterium]|nr:ROK family protein [Tepidisphaeraceae bacterium]
MYLGIEIGGTKVQVVAGSPAAIVRRWRGRVRPELGGAGICEQLREAIGLLLDVPEGGKVRAVGVGFGGPIDTRTGQIRRSHQIAGWENFPLRDWLSELAGVPVAVDNDANVAALGETFSGAAIGSDPVFYATLGSGVGGGLVAGGRIYHGLPPGESELGHLRLDRSGTTLESRCSGWAVDARIRQLAAHEPAGTLARLIGEVPGAEARHLPQALRLGDPAARRILEETAQDLALGLSHVVHLFHPHAIILGGGLSLVGEPLRLAVADALQPMVMPAFLPAPDILLAGLGEDAVPIGALHLADQAISATG